MGKVKKISKWTKKKLTKYVVNILYQFNPDLTVQTFALFLYTYPPRNKIWSLWIMIVYRVSYCSNISLFSNMSLTVTGFNLLIYECVFKRPEREHVDKYAGIKGIQKRKNVSMIWWLANVKYSSFLDLTCCRMRIIFAHLKGI